MEHFSTIADRRAYHLDANLELRDYTATALSATTNGTAIEVNPRKFNTYKALINFATYTSFTTGSARWSAKISVSDVSAGTYTDISQDVELNGDDGGQIELPLSGALATYLDSDSAFLRITFTKTGAPGNLTVGAFLVPA